MLQVVNAHCFCGDFLTVISVRPVHEDVHELPVHEFFHYQFRIVFNTETKSSIFFVHIKLIVIYNSTKCDQS